MESAVAAPQFAFTGSKAGMQDVDKAQVNRIIEEASRGNAYYEKAKSDEERVREKGRILRAQVEALTSKDLSVAESFVNKRVSELELETQDMESNVFVTIDMDQFFVGVEIRDRPELRDKPVAVGIGLISTSNYVARKYGVRSAMPEFIARKLCPQLICVPHRMNAYAEASHLARSVFREYDENFSTFSLDEAVLNLTKFPALRGLNLKCQEGVDLVSEIVDEIRQRVCAKTGGLTCSAGVACTPMLAKICSEENKPNGHFILPAFSRKNILDFVRRLSVRKIPGIGKNSQILLETGFRISTVEDLWACRFQLNRTLTPALTDFYLQVPLAATTGFGDYFSSGGEVENKSLSVERTFKATSSVSELKEKLLDVCNQLANDVKEVIGKTLTLKLKNDVFEVRSRGETFKNFIGGSTVTGKFLYSLVEPMFMKEMPLCVRLIGVRLSGLKSGTVASNVSGGNQLVLDRFLVPTNTTTTTTTTTVCCPVCCGNLDHMTNDWVNRHIDSCLNSTVVSELIRETVTVTPKRLKKLEEYF